MAITMGAYLRTLKPRVLEAVDVLRKLGVFGWMRKEDEISGRRELHRGVWPKIPESLVKLWLVGEEYQLFVKPPIETYQGYICPSADLPAK